MGRFVTRYWEPDRAEAVDGSGGGEYRCFVPDPIAEWTPHVSPRLTVLLHEARLALTALHEAVSSSPVPASAGSLLETLEASASARIAGVVASPEQVLTELSGARSDPHGPASAVVALRTGTGELLRRPDNSLPVGIAAVRGCHKTLTAPSAAGGTFRERQAWVGSEPTPVGGAVAHPPPEALAELTADLDAFLSRDDLDLLVQAGLAHAQFMAISPFSAGTGRCGRALVHAILRRALPAPTVLPLSVSFTRDTARYNEGLNAYREPKGIPAIPSLSANLEAWLPVFAEAVLEACTAAGHYVRLAGWLSDQSRSRVGQYRTGGATDQLIATLPAHPVLTVAGAARRLGRPPENIRLSVNWLVAAGVLSVAGEGKARYRVFEAKGVLNALTSLDSVIYLPTPTPTGI